MYLSTSISQHLRFCVGHICLCPRPGMGNIFTMTGRMNCALLNCAYGLSQNQLIESKILPLSNYKGE